MTRIKRDPGFFTDLPLDDNVKLHIAEVQRWGDRSNSDYRKHQWHLLAQDLRDVMAERDALRAQLAAVADMALQ